MATQVLFGLNKASLIAKVSLYFAQCGFELLAQTLGERLIVFHDTCDLGGSSLISRVDVSGWGGDYYWEIDNAQKQKPVWLVNARLTWAVGKVELTGFVKNLFDRRYDVEFVPVNFGGTITGKDLGSASPPRQIGGSVKVRF